MQPPRRRTPGSPLTRARASLLAGALIALLGLASGVPRGEAYRLLDNGAVDYVVASDEAIRWAPGVWGPGANLTFRLADAPLWPAIFGSVAQAASAVEDGLARWGDIATADIRWSVSRTTGAAQDTWRQDGASTVFVNTAGRDFDRGAGLWFARNPSQAVWEITECDIGVPGSWETELQGLDSIVREFLVADESAKWFSWCLGLGASANFPSAEGPDGVGTPWTHETDLQAGASLLRPRSGWRESVGGISGSVMVGDEPASYTHVWAFPTTGSGGPIGSFANRSGAFTIEGLPPGDYVLWAHPIDGYDNRLGGAGAVTEVRDTVVAVPVTVTAGRTASGYRISMQRGR